MQPESVRPLSMSIVTTAGGLFSFLNAKTFVDINEGLGAGAAFAVYAAVNAVGVGAIVKLVYR